MVKAIDSLTFFLFIFSILFILKYTVRLISFLFGNEIEVASNRELILIFVAISYFLTYLIKF